MNANKQDAGGLPELPEPGHYDDYEGEWYWTGSQMRAYGELCRAAPAGGDDWPFLEEIGRDGKPTGYWIRKGSPAAARMSAPAGSGEVEEFAKRLDTACAYSDGSPMHDDCEPNLDAATVRQAAALLRKLQQGAEDPELLEDGRRYRYLMKHHPERCLGVDQLRAASQGQEGGKHG